MNLHFRLKPVIQQIKQKHARQTYQQTKQIKNKHAKQNKKKKHAQRQTKSTQTCK